tara:strand:+ start:439 stop:570 length:132 start_codon:yes stop_codon:yes gene_type:complete
MSSGLSGITDVLSQVKRWTGATRHFGHVSTGLPLPTNAPFSPP